MKMRVHVTSGSLAWWLQEYPFFTVKSVPSGFVVHLGGVVSARSVKLLDKIHNPGIVFLLW